MTPRRPGRRLLTLAGAALAVLGAAPATALAAWPTTPPTTSPPNSPPPTTGADAPMSGIISLVDDSGLLRIDVPATWGQTDTAPEQADDGSAAARIIAAADLDAFVTGYEQPGVIYRATSFQADTATALAGEYDFGADCTAGPITPYRDGYFTVGSTQTWTSCAGGVSQIVTIFANPADESFSAVLLVQLLTSDPAPIDTILDSFWVTSPTSTIVFDDTGTMSVNAPVAWTDTATSPPPGGTGDHHPPTIIAAPDLALFNAGRGDGLSVHAETYAPDVSALLAEKVVAGCTVAAATPFTLGDLTGVLQESASCNGRQLTVIAANAAGRTDYTLVAVSLTAPTDTASRAIARNSFGFVPTDAHPGPTVSLGAAPTATPTPTTVAPVGPTTSGPPEAETTPTVASPPPAPLVGVELEDDWGMLTLTVPDSWSFTDTGPWVEDQGTTGGGPTSARIVAATAADYAENWATSSVRFSAFRHVDDLHDVLANGVPECAPGAIVPYDDGYFVGLRQDFTGCGGTSRNVNIAANPPDGSFTAWLTIVVTPEHEAAIEMILQSFNSLVAQPTYTLTDATGLLTMDVPTSWRDWGVEPLPADNGTTPYPTIWASVTGDGPTDSYVWYQAFTYKGGDLQALVTANDESTRCTDGGVTDYDDGYFVGVMHAWTDCDATAGSTITQVFADPPDRAFTAALTITFGTAQPEGTLDVFLDTFFVVRPAGT